jgi:hypothetical protein
MCRRAEAATGSASVPVETVNEFLKILNRLVLAVTPPINTCEHLLDFTMAVSIPNPRWIVDFQFRISDERQRQAVEALGILGHDVVRLFCRVRCPGSIVVEPEGVPVLHIVCKSRDQARLIIRTFGGRLHSNSCPVTGEIIRPA